jgi:plastocyanin
MKRAIVLLVAALALTAVPAHAATVDVNAVAATFVPAVFAAHKSDTVVLHNLDLLMHTLTADSLMCGTSTCSTGSVSFLGTGSFTIPSTTANGQYLFHCNFHPINMRAVLVVN